MTPSTVACVVAISFPISILLPSVCLDDSIAGRVEGHPPKGRSGGRDPRGPTVACAAVGIPPGQTSEKTRPLGSRVNRGEVEADDRTGVPASSRCALRGSRLRRVRLSFGAGRTAEDLDDHPKVAQGVEVGDVNPAVLTAEHHAVLALCSRGGLVEVRCGDGDVVHALALLGEEAGVDAVLVERLDKLPHHPADHGDGDAVGALDGLSVLAVVVRCTEVYPVEPPRADPVAVFVPPYRRLQIAHDDPELHSLVEDGLSHRSPSLRSMRRSYWNSEPRPPINFGEL